MEHINSLSSFQIPAVCYYDSQTPAFSSFSLNFPSYLGKRCAIQIKTVACGEIKKKNSPVQRQGMHFEYYAKYKMHFHISVCWRCQHTLKETRQRKRCHEVWVMLIKFVVPLYMCLTSSQVGLIDSFASLLFLLLFACLFFLHLIKYN